MSSLKDNPIIKERQKRKFQREDREQRKKEVNLHSALMVDLVDSLSKKGITIKNVNDIVQDLISKGWLKKSFEKRKW